MTYNFGLTFFSVFISLFSVITGKAQQSFSKDFASSKINGAWRINYAESDNPILKMQTVLQKNLAEKILEKNAGARNESLPTMSVSLVPPPTLILAGENEKSITINEEFDELIFTRTVMTDGKPHDGEIQNGAKFSLTAIQHPNLLKIEIISPRGNRMIETYELAVDEKKLVVTLRFENSQAEEILSLRRVYDRTTLNLLPSGGEIFQ